MFLARHHFYGSILYDRSPPPPPCPPLFPAPSPSLLPFLAVGAVLVVKFTPGYPDTELPIIDVVSPTGITPTQVKELKGAAQETAEANLGTPLVYTVAERVREWLTENNMKPSDGSAFDEMMRRKAIEAAGGGGGSASGALSRDLDPSILRKVVISAEEADETVRRKRDGTPVTRESFLAWQAKFDAEMEAKAREDEAKGLDVMIGYARRLGLGRATGRQLFEADASLATSDVAAEAAAAAGAGAAAASGGAGAASAAGGGGGGAAQATYVFDASAFADDGELPSDDDDDEEYEPGDTDDEDDDDDDYDDEDDDEEDE